MEKKLIDADALIDELESLQKANAFIAYMFGNQVTLFQRMIDIVIETVEGQEVYTATDAE